MWAFWFIVVLLVIVILTLPVYPYSRTWSYYPSGAAAVLLLLMLVLGWLSFIAIQAPWQTAPPTQPG